MRRAVPAWLLVAVLSSGASTVVAQSEAERARGTEEVPTLQVKGADLPLLKTVRRIATKVEVLRGERFAKPPVAVRVPDDLRQVAAEIRAFNVLGQERLDARGRAWADLGLGGPTSPRQLMQFLSGDLPGVGFDPSGNRLMVSMDRLTEQDFIGGDDEGEGSTILHLTGVRPDEPLVGHLLMHVRQRERLGGDYLAATTDQLLAQSAWAEGEANLLAVRYLFAGMGLEDEVVSYSKDPAEFLDGRLVPLGMADLTGVESRMAEFVYREGYAQATEMYAAGGWARIQRWMGRVRTTRDLLHPDAAALPPVTFPEAEPPVEGFVLRDTDSLGEQGVITLVSLLSGKDNLALQAGDGWHGDELRRWEPARGQQGVTEWLTRWISQDDVEDFDYALTKILRLRFPDREVRRREDGTRILDTAHQQLVIERSELLVRLEIRPLALVPTPAVPASSTP